MKKQNQTRNIIIILGIIGLLYFGAVKQSLFIEAPIIDAGQDGTVRVSLTEAFQQGGYDDFKASVWIDSELLCCRSLNSGSFECQVYNPTSGDHTIEVFVVSYSGSAFAGGDICNDYAYPNMNLVTSNGVQNLRVQSKVAGAVFSFQEKSQRWYVVPKVSTTTTTTTIPSPPPTPPNILEILADFIQSIIAWAKSLRG